VTVNIHPAYINTYWYAFKPADAAKHPDIIKNRNAFAAHFNLAPWKVPRRLWSSPLGAWMRDNLDHVEYYKMESSRRPGGRMVMFHDYDTRPKTVAKFCDMGWDRIVPLYTEGAASYQMNAQSDRLLFEFMARAAGIEDYPVMICSPVALSHPDQLQPEDQ
jgi:hypothetical protein